MVKFMKSNKRFINLDGYTSSELQANSVITRAKRHFQSDTNCRESVSQVIMELEEMAGYFSSLINSMRRGSQNYSSSEGFYDSSSSLWI